jgi:hexokinase
MVGEPNWTALRKAVEDEIQSLNYEWGTIKIEEKEIKEKKEDIIRKHEEHSAGINLLDKGAASTTKKIVQSSVQSRKKMMMFDDALK